MADTRHEPVVLSVDEQVTLERWARRPKSAQALALRCRIVLECAKGGSNVQVGAPAWRSAAGWIDPRGLLEEITVEGDFCVITDRGVVRLH